MEGVYVLHFNEPMPDTHANRMYGGLSHYVGRSADIEKRVKRHKTGGSAKTKRLKELGIEFQATLLDLPNDSLHEGMVMVNPAPYCDYCSMGRLCPPI